VYYPNTRVATNPASDAADNKAPSRGCAYMYDNFTGLQVSVAAGGEKTYSARYLASYKWADNNDCYPPG
jgi:hypothetical protein